MGDLAGGDSAGARGTTSCSHSCSEGGACCSWHHIPEGWSHSELLHLPQETIHIHGWELKLPAGKGEGYCLF